MKFLILFFIFSFPIWADLSKNDIEEIRKIVKEEVGREVGALRQEVNIRFSEIDKRFEEIDKRFHWLYILLSSIIGLIGIMVGSVLWLARQERPMSMKHYKEITKRQKYIENEISELRIEVEGLKPQPA